MLCYPIIIYIFIYLMYRPPTSSATTPRPFGNAVVDGFDFDIESTLVAGVDPDQGYGTMVDTLRTLYDTDKSKTYYISAAPREYSQISSSLIWWKSRVWQDVSRFLDLEAWFGGQTRT